LGEVISKTFELYRRDFLKYLVLFAVVGAITGAVTAYARATFVLPPVPPNSTPSQILDWLPGFVSALVALAALIVTVNIVFVPIAQGGAIKQASEQIEKAQADLWQSVRYATSKLLSIWALSIIVGVIVILGTIALVVPGIILSIMFSLAIPVLLIENKGVFDSMGRSRELVARRWLKTFATFLVLGIVVIIPAVVVSLISGPFGAASPVVNGILSAFYQPLFPILLAVYYHSNLARIAPVQSSQPQPIQAPVAQAGAKYCSSCGAQLESSAVFCTKCGARQPV
jgi:hypothetical protein